MELKIAELKIPEQINFNYDELKAELTAKAHDYEVMVYGEDQIKDAKADKAALNKLKKALNDERINREREYMKPFNEFKAQINEIIGIIDKPIAVIDTQVKAYEQKKQEEKQDAIKQLWLGIEHPDFILLGTIWNPKWTNTTFTLKKVEEEIRERLHQIESDVKTINSLETFSFEALEDYKQHLDLGRAIAEGQRLADIQKRKEEAEKAKVEAQMAAMAQPVIDTTAVEVKEDITYPEPTKEEPKEEPKQEVKANWVNFSALLTVENAKKLKAFFEDNNIQFKAI
jgi:hypothetical protein